VIIPDVNCLVYAFRREAAEHERCAAWLGDVVGGSEELGLADHCLNGLLRIVTNPRIFADPAPGPAAISFVDWLRAASRSYRVAATASTWSLLGEMVADDPGLRGNMMPDAYLAALTISHGARLASSDRGFGRFRGLDQLDPLAA
jgi:toxin-antitoxin system PIN domain toxin